MSNLLVIGGTGFFGKSILDSFNNGILGDFSIEQVILTGRKIPKDIFFDNEKIIFYKYDGSIDKQLPDADYIIYAASSTTTSTYYDENYINEISIQKKSIDNFDKIISSKKVKKILYTSSGAVYGQENLNKGNTHESTDCNSQDFTSEKKNYARVKLLWEEYFLNNHSFKSSIARCFAFVGPKLPLKKHFAIGNFINNIILGEDIEVLSKIPVYRSYMYSDDLVLWLTTILIKSSDEYNIFNVGSDEEIELHQLANFLTKKFLKKNYLMPKLESIKKDRYVPCIDKARNKFNLSVNFNLEESLIQTLKELNIDFT